MQIKKSASLNRMGMRKVTAYSLLGIFILLFVVVLYFLLSSYGIEVFSINDKKIDLGAINIVDQCSYLAGQLLHTINVADECSLKCRSECSVLDREYLRDEFSFGNSTCNSCECFCK